MTNWSVRIIYEKGITDMRKDKINIDMGANRQLFESQSKRNESLVGIKN